MHPNAQCFWPEIRCQRGHAEHSSIELTVRLGVEPHGYHDFPQVPKRLARSWRMNVWDPRVHPVDGKEFCPAHDAVSETIVSHHIWEPVETIVAFELLTSAAPGSIFLDLGAQIGWFSLLALSAGIEVVAYDAESESLRLLERSAALNGWGSYLTTVCERITDESAPLPLKRPVALAKIDIEGAEPAAIKALSPAIEAGLVNAILIEVSPVFHGGYPDLIAVLAARGYVPYRLPDKQPVPLPLAEKAGTLLEDLEPLRMNPATLKQEIAGWHQANLLLVKGAW